MRDKNFGFEKVSSQEKTVKVNKVFSDVHSYYDRMNDLMSLGLHRLWKRYAVSFIKNKSNLNILDLAGGTGDITRLLSKKLNDTNTIYLTDINSNMLETAKEKLLDSGTWNNVKFIHSSAENLEFDDNFFHYLIIGFGLRNFTDKTLAIDEMYRVLKPGASFVVLEFSKPKNKIIKQLYNHYSFTWLPFLGNLIASDSSNYNYLAESIRVHPNQEALQLMFEKAGFEDCSYENILDGVVAIHRG